MDPLAQVARLGRGTATSLALVALASLVGGCAGVRGYADYDHEVDFGRYQSFDFLPLQAPAPGSAESDPANSQLVARRVQREIERILEEKGYRRAPREQADFLVASQVTTREKVDVYTTPYPYRLGLWRGPYDTYSSSYTEGTLVIDMLDAGSQEVVWHGWASEPVSDDGGSLELAAQAVAAILQHFPARGAAPEPG